MNAGLTFDEWWHFEGIHKMPRGDQPPEYAHIVELAWNAALAAAPPDYTLVPNSALRWLFGEEGHFEDPVPTGIRPRPYWWRSEFRRRIVAAPDTYLKLDPTALPSDGGGAGLTGCDLAIASKAMRGTLWLHGDTGQPLTNPTFHDWEAMAKALRTRTLEYDALNVAFGWPHGAGLTVKQVRECLYQFGDGKGNFTLGTNLRTEELTQLLNDALSKAPSHALSLERENHSGEYQSPRDRAIAFQDCQYESVEDETKWLEANFLDAERIARKRALGETSVNWRQRALDKEVELAVLTTEMAKLRAEKRLSVVDGAPKIHWPAPPIAQGKQEGLLLEMEELETFASDWRNYLLTEREYFSKMDELETMNNHESVARAWCRSTAHVEDNLGRITELFKLLAALASSPSSEPAGKDDK